MGRGETVVLLTMPFFTMRSIMRSVLLTMESGKASVLVARILFTMGMGVTDGFITWSFLTKGSGNAVVLLTMPFFAKHKGVMSGFITSFFFTTGNARGIFSTFSKGWNGYRGSTDARALSDDNGRDSEVGIWD